MGKMVRRFNRTSRFNPYTLTRFNNAISRVQALKARFGGSRSYTMTKRKRARSGLGVTTQHDKQVVYRKRRMPRRRRRGWKRFARKVNAVSEKDLGSRTVLRNDLVNITTNMDTAAESAHTRWYFMLYGATSGTAYYNDLSEIGQDTDLGTTGKAIFKSGVLDLTFRNNSFRAVGSVNPPITLEVDVYELSVGTVLGDNAANLGQVMSEGSTETATIPGQSTALVGTQRGWTPWDFPSALGEYRVKIWKKTKYFLGENQTFTYQFRDPRRHVVDKQKMTTTGENIPGLSRYVYVIFKPTPGYLYLAVPTDNYALSVGVTRKYLYKVLQNTQDYDMYNT